MTEATRWVYVVDDDTSVRQSTHFLLKTFGYSVQSFGGGRDFIDTLPSLAPGCVLLDVRMPEIDGIKLVELHASSLRHHPIIVITGHGDIAVAVHAMKLGAIDFIEKPFEEAVLLETIEQAFSKLDALLKAGRERETAGTLIGRLTSREVDVLRGLLAGLSNKVIAFKLGLSTRTVEMHRARMMERLAVRSLPEAVKIALTAELTPYA